MEKSKRNVCFVITNRIHYARNRLILEELRRNDDVHLQLVVGGAALTDKYGNIEPILTKDGFTIDERIVMNVSGDSTTIMAKSAGLGLLELSSVFERMQPDIVIVRGDRYEMLSIATAAAYMNIPVAHIEGGDVTGTIDESVRHAITKLAHIHFATNEDSKRRILRMGEHPDYIFNVGSPDLECAATNGFNITNEFLNEHGVGDTIDVTKPYLIVMQHPVTTEIEDVAKQIDETLSAIHTIQCPAIWFWPNSDAGAEILAGRVREFHEQVNPPQIRFIKNLPPEEFLGLLKQAACLVGNSSSGLKECSYWGIPVVNVGTRQNGRYQGVHVINSPHDRTTISEAIKKQLTHGTYPSDSYYHKEGTSKTIVDILRSIPLYRQKQFYD